MILMVIAVVCGLAASYLTSRMLANQQPAEEEKVTILVAKQKIPMGTLLKDPEKFFVTKEFTKGQEPKKAFTSFEQLKEKRLNKTISAEVHVTPDDLLSKDQEGLPAEIPPGYRAFAITVRADTDAGHFVIPRSHVDVVSTTRGDTGALSRIILQDVLVLAVDQQKVRESDKAAIPASTVTLQIKPDEAEKLSLAASLGELRLILRSEDDHEVVHTHGSRPSDVVHGAGGGSNSDDPGSASGGAATSPKIPDVPAGPPAPVVAVKPEPEPEIKTHTLTIYNGDVPTKAVFVLGEKGAETTTRIDNAPLGPPPGGDEDDGGARKEKPGAKKDKASAKADAAPESSPKKEPQSPSKGTSK
jgi:pilus assembly protein CpaB